MATVFIENIDGNLLEQFKSFAVQQGIVFSIFDKRTEKQTVNQVVGLTSLKSNGKEDSVSHALLSIPTIDGYDEEDIFARSECSAREFDWTE